MQQRRLQYFRHVVRMEYGRYPNLVLEGYVHGKGSRERPRNMAGWNKLQWRRTWNHSTWRSRKLQGLHKIEKPEEGPWRSYRFVLLDHRQGNTRKSRKCNLWEAGERNSVPLSPYWLRYILTYLLAPARQSRVLPRPGNIHPAACNIPGLDQRLT